MEMENNKSEGQQLLENLEYKNTNAWETNNEDIKAAAFGYCEQYKCFLDTSKTEREYTKNAILEAQKNGYQEIEQLYSTKGKLQPGDKVFKSIKNKALILAVVGNKPLKEGANLIGSHIDAPRIDIKQNPLYENTDMAFLKTHYYGGIKKYQWVTIPLALHGLIITKDNNAIEVVIGEDDTDPVFTITDLLPHLAADQMQKKMSEGIAGEDLNLLFGSIPYNDDKVKDKVKLNVLNILNQKYGIKEEDFISAELEIVPAFKARDIGMDRGMVGAYGQDDRVCAYPSMTAIFEIDTPEKTAVCVLADKEEIGSMGNTGAESVFIENFMAKLCAYTNEFYNDIILRDCLENSKMLSADVSAGVDPNYEGTHDKLNASFIGKGVAMMKYSGARGKGGASDANAELVADIRRIFTENEISWQTTELGKVDKGGGGTIARYVANLGIDVLDCGVPVLCMHSPFEVASKIDIFMAHKAYKAFYINAR